MQLDQYTTVNGYSIRYRDFGEGKPLLLIHGIGGFIEEWAPMMELLCKSYRVIALDLPGHGLSDKPIFPYTIAHLTVILKAFIDVLGIDKIFLVGHSLGGAISLNLLIEYPQLIDRLMLINSAFTCIPFSMRLASFGFLRKITIKVPLFIVKAAARRSFHKEAYITKEWLGCAYRYMNTPEALPVMLSIIRSNISLKGLHQELLDSILQGLQKATTPVLILYGENDRILPVKNSILLRQYLKNSKCVSVSNCGHEMQYECCELVCAHVLRFFNTNSKDYAVDTLIR